VCNRVALPSLTFSSFFSPRRLNKIQGGDSAPQWSPPSFQLDAPSFFLTSPCFSPAVPPPSDPTPRGTHQCFSFSPRHRNLFFNCPPSFFPLPSPQILEYTRSPQTTRSFFPEPPSVPPLGTRSNCHDCFVHLPLHPTHLFCVRRVPPFDLLPSSGRTQPLSGPFRLFPFSLFFSGFCPHALIFLPLWVLFPRPPFPPKFFSFFARHFCVSRWDPLSHARRCRVRRCILCGKSRCFFFYFFFHYLRLSLFFLQNPPHSFRVRRGPPQGLLRGIRPTIPRSIVARLPIFLYFFSANPFPC